MSEYNAIHESGERRSEERTESLRDCSAVVRLKGIPVYQFKLKDLSGNGTCFLVKEESSIMRHLQVGQEIEIQFHGIDGIQSAAVHRSQIMHITRSNHGRYKGHCMVGVRILGRLSLR
ncbi:MAG TPA: PilZ domain-containing protein [Desulfobacterales bacterium]